MSDNESFSRRKILLGMAGVGGIGAAGGAGTLAYLSDDASVESVFESGSLLIDADPETMSFTDLDEQEENDTATTICNAGSLPVRNVVLTGLDIDGSDAVAKAIEVTSATYAGTDVFSAIQNGDQNDNGWVDLHDLSEYLSGETVSLTEAAGTLGSDDVALASEDNSETAECHELVIGTKMHYENLDGSEQQSVSATLEIMAEQEAQLTDGS